jgi:hypothetical protein
MTKRILFKILNFVHSRLPGGRVIYLTVAKKMFQKSVGCGGKPLQRNR